MARSAGKLTPNTSLKMAGTAANFFYYLFRHLLPAFSYFSHIADTAEYYCASHGCVRASYVLVRRNIEVRPPARKNKKTPSLSPAIKLFTCHDNTTIPRRPPTQLYSADSAKVPSATVDDLTRVLPHKDAGRKISDCDAVLPIRRASAYWHTIACWSPSAAIRLLPRYAAVMQRCHEAAIFSPCSTVQTTLSLRFTRHTARRLIGI